MLVWSVICRVVVSQRSPTTLPSSALHITAPSCAPFVTFRCRRNKSAVSRINGMVDKNRRSFRMVLRQPASGIWRTVTGGKKPSAANTRIIIRRCTETADRRFRRQESENTKEICRYLFTGAAGRPGHDVMNEPIGRGHEVIGSSGKKVRA